MRRWNITFKPLFKLLIDRDIKKGELCKIANISESSVTKMANDKLVKIDIIVRVCEALDVNITDVMQLVDHKGIPVWTNDSKK